MSGWERNGYPQVKVHDIGTGSDDVRDSWPSLAKLAERILGAILNVLAMIMCS